MLHSNRILRAYKTASWVTPEEIVIKPYPEWNAKTYQVNRLSKVISIEENHVFDLGNFQFKVGNNVLLLLHARLLLIGVFLSSKININVN